VRRTGFSLAEWTEEELRKADETAREVVRRIWGNRFSPRTVPPPAFFEEFAAICQDGRFGAAAAMDGEVEEAGS
jgi:hypothetical protein